MYMGSREELVEALAAAGIDKGLAEQLLEIPQQKELGDFALPCFKLASQMRKNPAIIAQELAEKIVLPKGLRKAEAKGPYLNFFLDEGKFGSEVVSEILSKKEKYGMGEKTGTKAIVEYCQANPMKAFHIGHVRNICIGESIARLHEALGEKVIRIDYGGDVGPHVSKTIYAYRNLPHPKEPKTLKEQEKWLGDLYVTGSKAVKGNADLEGKMREMVVALEKRKDKQLLKDWKRLRKMSLDCFKEIFRELGVKFDRIIMESEVEKEGIEIAQQLLEQKVAIRDKGAILVDLDEYRLGKFLILKSDGAALYSSKDIALAKFKKKEYNPDKSFYVVGAEQSFYFQQLAKIVELLNARAPKPEYSPVNHISYELVRLEGGKMSSREGNVITYSELFDEVFVKAFTETLQRHPDWPKKKIGETARALALAGIKFGMLCHDRSSIITFNWEKATSLEGETGPFILYSFARANSILRKAGKLAKAKPKKMAPVKLELDHEKEKRLVSLLAAYKDKIKEAAEQSSPHKIAFYLLELAQEFNSFYHEVPVLQAQPEKAGQRIALVKAVMQVLENGLSLLNIGAIEEM